MSLISSSTIEASTTQWGGGCMLQMTEVGLISDLDSTSGIQTACMHRCWWHCCSLGPHTTVTPHPPRASCRQHADA